MERLAFLTDHPIRRLREIRTDRKNQIEFVCWRLTGDHPGFKTEKVAFDRILPLGDLYIEVNDRHWAPLFPFITLLSCEQCGATECSFVDKIDTKKRTASLKSFERGVLRKLNLITLRSRNLRSSESFMPEIPPRLRLLGA